MIGERLKKIRKEKGLSQKSLADLLGTSSGYLSEIEQNKTIPGGKFLSSLNRALSISIDWLLTGEGDPYLSTICDAEDRDKQSPLSERSSKVMGESIDDITKDFKDISYAKDLNIRLVELESLNSEAFKKAGAYIKGLLDGLRTVSSKCHKYAGPERRLGERRVKDNPKKYKGAKDRRSRKDRRVAFQE